MEDSNFIPSKYWKSSDGIIWFKRNINFIYRIRYTSGYNFLYFEPWLRTRKNGDLFLNIHILKNQERITVQLETNILNANTLKMNKYEHFITDITTRDVSVDPFEIASKGYISPLNKANLKKMLSSANPVLSFKAKCENLSSLSVL